jgi:cystathionine beta-lyase
MYDFDTPAKRAGTGSIKWDIRATAYHNPDALPFWIADSDYMVAPEIIEALHDAVDRSIFGYTNPNKEYFDAVINWFATRHNWQIEQEWITPTTGIVSEIANAIGAFTDAGDKILIQTPVYDPFKKRILSAGRAVVENRLAGDPVSGYTIDFADLEAKFKDGVKMMIFCSPHNPVGRVWTEDEVRTVAALCQQYGVLLVSDEIHWDLMIGGTKHFTAGCAGTPDNVIVLTAPSKTFNLAGLGCSNTIVPNSELRAKLQAYHTEHSIEKPNVLGFYACKAAYQKGAQWADEQNAYLTENAKLVYDFIARELPDVKVAKLEGTYLMWMDISASGATDAELISSMAQAGACLNDGSRYGGKGFVRLNIACPRAQLEAGLKSIAAGYKAACK